MGASGVKTTGIKPQAGSKVPTQEQKMHSLYFNDGTIRCDTEDMDNDVLDRLETLVRILNPGALFELQQVLADQRLSTWISLEAFGGTYDVYLWWA
jgi:hypothetical protein